uniref:Uncharacterized protein n=1 Tax=Manihot esculenta TaxID=3983 RepID=A0A2C9W0V1_MANES
MTLNVCMSFLYIAVSFCQKWLFVSCFCNIWLLLVINYYWKRYIHIQPDLPEK